MGWTNDNEAEVIRKQEENKRINLSKKILKAIIFLMIAIIIIIGALIINVNRTSFAITVDEKEKNISKSDLLIIQNETTYVNIEEFADQVGYEFHNNEEYKAFTKEADKCYVKGKNETTTFYINENKIYKLPVDDVTSEYQEFTIKDKVIKIGEKPYASIETIELAFNVVINNKDKEFKVYTLQHLVDIYDKRVQEWGYTSIANQEFENQKLLLHGYIIVKKDGGLYKIIDLKNEGEIVSDKYSQIQFIEYKEEFFVTNSLKKVGIINLDATVKIEPLYDSIEIFDSQKETYLVYDNGKYGIVKSGDRTVLPAEYDSIGVHLDAYINENSNCYVLDKLIPVCKDGKWGAVDKNGRLVISMDYDGLGSAKAITLDDTSTNNNSDIKPTSSNLEKIPVLSIKECDGIVVKKNNKYGIVDAEGKLLVQIAVDDIYSLKKTDDTLEYFMTYNGSDINIIDSLKAAGLVKEQTIEKENTEENKETNNNNNNIANDITNNSIIEVSL